MEGSKKGIKDLDMERAMGPRDSEVDGLESDLAAQLDELMDNPDVPEEALAHLEKAKKAIEGAGAESEEEAAPEEEGMNESEGEAEAEDEDEDFSGLFA